tara:strand:- start:987 stop:1370 length:384 start_codon:yes stop_codon:yes gene_type:complete
MRNLFLGLLLIISTTIIALPLNSNIVNALKTGNATELSKFMEASIDLSIPENEGVFSKTQSTIILKTFFFKNKPSDFKVLNSGDAKNNTHYAIGNLETVKGQFRVYILYKEINGKSTIVELRIETDE